MYKLFSTLIFVCVLYVFRYKCKCAEYGTKVSLLPTGFHEQPDVLEVFLTEFQMRLLWGSRGAEASREERYEKFDKVLTALSNRLEPHQAE